MNVIAPVFEPQYAAFASANQDMIRETMRSITPLALRNNGWGNDAGKGTSGLRKGSVPHRVFEAMAEGEIYTISQLAKSLSLTQTQASNAIRDLRKGGYVSCKPRHSGQFNGYYKAVR